MKTEVTDLGNGVMLEMNLIPTGMFMMGSPKDEKDRYENEDQHEVTTSKPFYMGIYQVTQEEWKGVMGSSNPSTEKGSRLPVTDVSWLDCQVFIKKLNDKKDGVYRLPTEAEWEYSCRAGTTTAYSFGDSISPQDANYDESGFDKPVEVGSYEPNAFGLYDMHGNVFEWCGDWYKEYTAKAVVDPKGPDSGKGRVLRGGSFFNSARYSRSANRDATGYGSIDFRSSNYGFRLARTS